jgi:hypothetical protein
MSRINPGPLKQCDALGDEEQLMLNYLEESTGKLTKIAGAMNDEATAQIALLNGILLCVSHTIITIKLE